MRRMEGEPGVERSRNPRRIIRYQVSSMRMTKRTLFRRLALALAAAQLVAYAAVPVLEALTERAPGPVALERAHTASCVVLHTPDSCLACQLLSAHGQRADGACLPTATSDLVSPAA